MAATAPRIACLDLDTFFVSVERLLDPKLVGKPVVVGGKRGGHGVVVAASYEVRPFGVRSGLSIREASRLAPRDAIFLSGRHGVYGDYAERVRRIAENYTPESRVASIDEMYLDFRGCEGMYHRAGDADRDATIERTVRELTARIQSEVGLPSSCGIATSRVVAKVASGVAKPAGVLMIPAGGESEFLAPLPVRKLPGIGAVAEGKLHAAGLITLGAVARTDFSRLRDIFGGWAQTVHDNVRGRGIADLGRDRPAFREHDPVGEAIGSISNERTFFASLHDRDRVERELCALTERVCWRARKRQVKARTVTLKLRYRDFHTLTRARTIGPTNSELEIYPVLTDLLRAARTRRGVGVRLLGVQLSGLGLFDEQLELFGGRTELHSAVDAVRERYGFSALRIASGASQDFE